MDSTCSFGETSIPSACFTTAPQALKNSTPVDRATALLGATEKSKRNIKLIILSVGMANVFIQRSNAPNEPRAVVT